MKNKETVTVTWFDELKGIGEGLTSKDCKIFLNRLNMMKDNRFLNLKAGEQITCEIQQKDNHFFASKILKENDVKITVEKSTFLDLT